MKSRFFLPVAAMCLFAAASAEPPGQPSVTFTAETPSISVMPGAPGRQFLELPALEYTFDVNARCDDDWTAESLSLNVADSRVAAGRAELSATPKQTLVLSIPARQLAPVAIHDFCRIPQADSSPDDGLVAAGEPPLTIDAFVSVQASLLCRKDADRRITYVTQPLGVTLICERLSADAAD